MIIEKLLEKRAGIMDDPKMYWPEAAGAVGGGILGYLMDRDKPWRGTILGTLGGGVTGAVAKQYYLNYLAEQALDKHKKVLDSVGPYGEKLDRLFNVLGMKEYHNGYVPPRNVDSRVLSRINNVIDNLSK